MKDEWEQFEAELLEDPETRAAFEKRLPAFELASKLITLRSKLGLSQRQLADAANMTQPEIARLESGTIQPTWETLSRVLHAVGAELAIRVRDKDGKLVRVSMSPAPASRRAAER